MAFEDALVSRPVSVVIPVISSLAGALRAYVSSVLPQDYIKDYFIDTEVPITRVYGRRRFRPLSKSQVAMRQLPLMSVRVEPTADSSEFSSGVTFWRSTRFLLDPTQLTRIIADDHNLRYAGFESERMILRFTVSFTVETELRASELMMYLRRTLPVNNRVYLNDIDVVTEVPRDILRTIWADMRLGDGSDPADVETFTKYLRAVSNGNIEQQINSASGRVTYSYSYRTNPMLNSVGAPTMSVNREANVVKNATVEMPFEFDVSVPVAYAYRGEASEGPALLTNSNLILSEMDNSTHFSASIRIRPPENIENGLQLVFLTAIITGGPDKDSRIDEDDVTELASSIAPRTRTLLEALDKNGNSDKIVPKLWLDGNEVHTSGWLFDLNSFELIILHLILQPQQRYHFAIYADVSDIDKLAPVERRPQAPKSMIPVK